MVELELWAFLSLPSLELGMVCSYVILCELSEVGSRLPQRSVASGIFYRLLPDHCTNCVPCVIGMKLCQSLFEGDYVICSGRSDEWT